MGGGASPTGTAQTTPSLGPRSGVGRSPTRGSRNPKFSVLTGQKQPVCQIEEVIVAQGPAEIALPEGVWILAADRGGMAAALAEQLATQNQRVVLAARRPGGHRRGGDRAWDRLGIG